MTDLHWFGVAVLPLIVGLVQVLKSAFGLASRWAGLLAVVLGAGIGFGAAVSGGANPIGGAVGGLALGLAASGLWSTSKAVSGS